jgi:hemolysin activation/secretion protein
VLCLISAFLIVSIDDVGGQVVEERTAPVLLGKTISGLPSLTPDGTLAEPSDEPLGIILKGLVFLSEPAQISLGAGFTAPIDVSRAKLLQNPEFIELLQPFIGKPMSQKLVFDIRATVASYYRSRNLPLVAVIIPPQEITNGVIQILVLPFRAGDITASGNDWTPEDYILENVRLKPGDLVRSDELLEDVNWLNLNPYRNLSVVFEPGRKLGETNLTLRAREMRPWFAYTGYTNSGTRSTDRNRVFVGLNTANIPLLDHQLSYQLTGSPDFFYDDGIFGSFGEPDYVSHSASYFVPLPWRQKITLQVSSVETNARLTSPFTQESDTLLAYGDYAFPLPPLQSLRAEVYLGGEFKRQRSELRFSDTPVRTSVIDIFQIVGGVRGVLKDPFGETGFDLRGIFSPGNVGARNRDVAFATASANPNANSEYYYAYGALRRSTKLPFARSSVSTSVKFQFTNDSLPGIEQLPLGGFSSVRGYDDLETSGDYGLVVSNELRAPSVQMLSSVFRNISDQAEFYGFFDYGIVSDRFAARTDKFVSVGAGVDYALANRMNLGFSYGFALRDGVRTKKGDQRAQVTLTLRN